MDDRYAYRLRLASWVPPWWPRCGRARRRGRECCDGRRTGDDDHRHDRRPGVRPRRGDGGPRNDGRLGERRSHRSLGDCLRGRYSRGSRILRVGRVRRGTGRSRRVSRRRHRRWWHVRAHVRPRRHVRVLLYPPRVRWHAGNDHRPGGWGVDAGVGWWWCAHPAGPRECALGRARRVARGPHRRSVRVLLHEVRGDYEAGEE